MAVSMDPIIRFFMETYLLTRVGDQGWSKAVGSHFQLGLARSAHGAGVYLFSPFSPGPACPKGSWYVQFGFY